MKEHPILFSGEMVRAILEGRKTQTRRIVKPQPETYQSESGLQFELPGWHGSLGAKRFTEFCKMQIGYRLWVRETFCVLDQDHWWDCDKSKFYLYNELANPRRNACAYKAETDAEGDAIRQEYGYKWRPSIHMPRWASRLTLEVTGVRVERLQDISEKDAHFEGVKECCGEGHDGYHEDKCMCTFSRLWDSLYSKNGFGWDANPWVWVIEFRKVDATQNAGG